MSRGEAVSGQAEETAVVVAAQAGDESAFAALPDHRVSFLGRRLGSAFELRVVAIEPGQTMPYEEADWRDALVVVECGEIEVECVEGGRERFGRGAVLCLDGLPLRVLRNRGDLPAVLVAVSRRHPQSRPATPAERLGPMSPGPDHSPIGERDSGPH